MSRVIQLANHVVAAQASVIAHLNLKNGESVILVICGTVDWHGARLVSFGILDSDGLQRVYREWYWRTLACKGVMDNSGALGGILTKIHCIYSV